MQYYCDRVPLVSKIGGQSQAYLVPLPWERKPSSLYNPHSSDRPGAYCTSTLAPFHADLFFKLLLIDLLFLCAFVSVT